MENELKSLKAAMDESIFKDAAFDSNNKQAVREALNKKKRSFPLAPLVAFAALFLVVLIGMSTVLQNEQSAAPEPPPETHIFEGMILQGQTNSGDSLQFMDGNLTIFTDPMMSAVRPWTDPDDASSEQASETTYSKITVVREESLFSVYSDGKLVLTLTQTAPRMFEDAGGNVYVTQQYIEEAAKIEPTTEELLEQLEAPYDSIGKILHEYKLPTEGQIGASGTYENGYQFDRNTGFFKSRSYPSGESPPAPTEGQFIGMFMGRLTTMIEDQNANTTNYGPTDTLESSGVSHEKYAIETMLLPQLNQLRNYQQSHKELTSWLDETIALYQAVLNSTNIDAYHENLENAEMRMNDMVEVIRKAREIE